MPFQALARLLLKALFSSPKFKDEVIFELRIAAAKTTTKFDDSTVDTLEDIWSVIVPTKR